MRLKLTNRPLMLARRTHFEAIKANLIEFHGKTAAQASELVKPLEADASEMALHEEPYVTAFELARGAEVLPIERYRADRPKAVELLMRAKALVKAGNSKVDFKNLGKAAAAKIQRSEFRKRSSSKVGHY